MAKTDPPRNESRALPPANSGDVSAGLPAISESPWAEKAKVFIARWVDGNPELTPPIQAAFIARITTEEGFWNQPESVKAVYADSKDPGGICAEYLEEGEILQIRLKIS